MECIIPYMLEVGGRLSLEHLREMARDCLTPEERNRLWLAEMAKAGKFFVMSLGPGGVCHYTTPWFGAGLPVRDLAGREYVASRATGDAGDSTGEPAAWLYSGWPCA